MNETQKSRKVKVEEAKINTASVSIRQVTINARKMTLSVFRQIMKESIIDSETHELKGIPWGQVNYFWKDNEGDVHVLWQKGDELRRSVNAHGLITYKMKESARSFRDYSWKEVSQWTGLKEPVFELVKRYASVLTVDKNGNISFEAMPSLPDIDMDELLRNIEIYPQYLGKCLMLFDKYYEAEEEYESRVENLKTLDHLFIAV